MANAQIVEEIYAKISAFLRENHVELGFEVDSSESRALISDLYDGVATIDLRKFVTGRVKNRIPDEFLFLVFYASVKAIGQQRAGVIKKAKGTHTRAPTAREIREATQ